MTITGITTSNDSVKLTSGGNLLVNDDIALGTGNLFLNVTGNVTQKAGDTITAAGLALMVTGTTTLTDPGNNVTTLAANTGGTINFTDVDALTVGTVRRAWGCRSPGSPPATTCQADHRRQPGGRR